MYINDNVRKCVAFIGERHNEDLTPKGSVFFVARFQPGQKQLDTQCVYAVTARHVIDKLRERCIDVWIRLNLKDGTSTWRNTPAIDWICHPSDPTVDVCVARFQLTPELDHQVFPMTMGVTQEILSSDRFTLGHELFIAGLFQHHHGTNRNIPIIRVGNVACMTEERVRTKRMGEIEAYLVEARSIGGLSGSPVFLYLGAVRTKPVVFEVKKMHLLGLVHGHFDETDAERDSTTSKSASQVNTGIALVVPFHHVASVVEFAEAKWATKDEAAN